MSLLKDLLGSFVDLAKIFEDLQGSLIFLPRSLKIFKDLQWSFANLTKIFEDLQGSSNFLPRSLMNLYRSYPNLWGSSRILCWSCQDLEDPQFSCQDIWGSSKIFHNPLQILSRLWGSSGSFVDVNLRSLTKTMPTCISILYIFYMLFYSHHFCIFSLFPGLF